MVKDKARVRARLSALFPKASRLKNERLDALAAKLKATDDSTDEEIDEELQAINDAGFQTFEEIVKDDDKVDNALKNPRKKPETRKTEIDDEPNDDENNPLLKRLAALEQTLAQRDEQDKLSALHTKFKSDERLKGVPASWVKNNLPKSEEDFESAIEGLVADYKEFATQYKLEELEGSEDTTPPAAQKKKAGAVEEITDEEAAQIAGSLLGKTR